MFDNQSINCLVARLLTTRRKVSVRVKDASTFFLVISDTLDCFLNQIWLTAGWFVGLVGWLSCCLER